MITYAQMTQNRLSETAECLRQVLPYVDKAVIVDGGSIDDSIFYLRNLAQEEPKLNFYIYPWTDNFSAQRNNYLKHIDNDTWVLVSDPDEYFEKSTLEALPELVKTAEANGRDIVTFRCRSVSLKGSKRVWESLDTYWKGLLFKKYPGTVYTGNPHERLLNHPLRMMQTEFVYEHIKQENVIWHRGARNLFAGGGGPNLGNRNHRWVDLRKACSELGINSWHEFDKVLLRGNVPNSIREWMIKYHDVDGFDGASEHREVYKLYFRIYHPEEEPEHLRSKHIP